MTEGLLGFHVHIGRALNGDIDGVGREPRRRASQEKRFAEKVKSLELDDSSGVAHDVASLFSSDPFSDAGSSVAELFEDAEPFDELEVFFDVVLDDAPRDEAS